MILGYVAMRKSTQIRIDLETGGEIVVRNHCPPKLSFSRHSGGLQWPLIRCCFTPPWLSMGNKDRSGRPARADAPLPSYTGVKSASYENCSIWNLPPNYISIWENESANAEREYTIGPIYCRHDRQFPLLPCDLSGLCLPSATGEK